MQDMETTDDTPDTLISLRVRLAALEAKVAALSADNEVLSAENKRLKASEKAAFERIEELIEQIKLANMRHYAPKSEVFQENQLLLSLFNDAETYAVPQAPEPEARVKAPSKKKTRHGGRRTIDLSKLPKIVVEHELPEGERICPCCKEHLDDMKEEVTYEVRLVPAHLECIEHHRRIYVCPACSKKSQKQDVPATIVAAPSPVRPIPSSFASPSLLAAVISDKYQYGLPLYRIEQRLAQMGAPIGRATLSNWILKTYELWFCLIRERLKAHLLTQGVIHADETWVQVLREPDRAPQSKSYMWVFISGSFESHCACVYEYAPTRSGSVARDFLDGWGGYLSTDGYKPYFHLGKGITNTACLVHIRRKFAEIVKACGKSDDAGDAGVAVAMIDRIFEADRACKDMDCDGRKQAREKTVVSLMDAFEAWARQAILRAPVGLALEKAFSYALDFWPYVKNVCRDGSLELSNNIAERAIRPFVIGRKNWLFSNTPRGAKASAGIYSIITSARLNGLDPSRYIEWLLETMPKAGKLTDEVVDAMLPWSDAAQATCTLDPERTGADPLPDDPIVDIDPATFDED